MKKIITSLLVAIMIIGLVGCGSSEKKTPAGTKGYVFKSGEVVVTMNEKADPIIVKLGDPIKIFESESCAFKGLDKEYSYSGYVLKTYPDGDTDFVASVTLFDDTVETKEGIAIGATKEAVIEQYGACTDSETVCEYTKEDTKLLFIITDGLVSSIQYIAITD